MRKGGQSLTKSPDLLARLDAPLRQMTAAQYPVFSKSPLSLQESLLFPYISGLRFQQAVILKLGKEGFSAVLRDPPKNTRQILHPELYLAHDEPGQVDLPELDADEWKLSAKPRRLTEGDIGFPRPLRAVRLQSGGRCRRARLARGALRTAGRRAQGPADAALGGVVG